MLFNWIASVFRSTLHKSTVAVTICAVVLDSSGYCRLSTAPIGKNLLLRLRHADNRINSLILLCNTIYVRNFCSGLSHCRRDEACNGLSTPGSRPCIHKNRLYCEYCVCATHVHVRFVRLVRLQSRIVVAMQSDAKVMAENVASALIIKCNTKSTRKTARKKKRIENVRCLRRITIDSYLIWSWWRLSIFGPSVRIRNFVFKRTRTVGTRVGSMWFLLSDRFTYNSRGIWRERDCDEICSQTQNRDLNRTDGGSGVSVAVQSTNKM